MSQQRITITLSSETIKKIRRIQAGLILKSEGQVSFSGTVEMLLNEALAK